MSNRMIYVVIAIVACGALTVGIVGGGAAPAVTELSRVVRDRENTLVVTVRGPLTAAAVETFAAREQRAHGLVRVYVHGPGESPGAGEAEALYERRISGAFQRRY